MVKVGRFEVAIEGDYVSITDNRAYEGADIPIADLPALIAALTSLLVTPSQSAATVVE